MSLGEILFIPGVTDPLTQLRTLLFKQGQAGGIWVPSLSPTMISSESFGTGVQTFLDLSGNGKNATQASAGSRPAWGRVPKSGRRQQLLYSEDLTNAAWTKVGTTDAVSVGGGAFRLDNFSDANGARVQQRIPSAPSATWTGTIDVRGEGSDIGKPINILLIRGTTGTTVSNSVTVNLTADWQSVEVSRTLAVDNVDIDIRVNMVTGGPDSPFVRFPQMELGSSATAYQKSTTAFDITESGQRDCYYLQPDGVDDGMATASIDFSGTDKVTVFAAVRKLSDAGFGVITELTANADTTTGGFIVGSSTLVSDNPARRTYGAFAWNVSGKGVSLYAAPTTNIVTAIYDMSTASVATDIVMRVNGSVIAGSTTGSNLTGNFTNAVLNLFARNNGASSPFNGQCFGLIVAGGSYPLSTIQRVERILSRYTPGVSL